MPTKEFTTLNTWAAAMDRTLTMLGCDATEAFKLARLDRALLLVPDARYPTINVERLWHVMVEMTGDEAIGLKVAEQINPSDLHAVGLAILTSETLDDALRRLVYYGRTITNAVEITFSRKHGQVRICLERREVDEVVAREAFDAALASIVKMWRLITDNKQGAGTPLKVELARPRPANPQPWERFFSAPVVFGASQHCLYYPEAVLDQRLPGANPRLAELNEAAAKKYLLTLEDAPLSTQVCSCIIQQLPGGKVTEKEIARTLNINLRTLQRRLKLENTGFRQLLEKTRQEMAGIYMQRKDLSFSDIGFLLGFSDQGNFSRCFKRWYGCTPRQYRASLIR